jgi:hypothetical protein
MLFQMLGYLEIPYQQWTIVNEKKRENPPRIATTTLKPLMKSDSTDECSHPNKNPVRTALSTE